MTERTRNELTNILRTEGINAAGYGIISKLVMQDRQLTRDAKAIYSYFCSFAGAGEQAFPSVAKICYDLDFKTEDTFRKHMKLLVNLDYVRVTQKREQGKFARNIYTLVMCPNPTDNEISTDTQNSGDGKIRSRRNSGTNNNRTFKINNINKNINQSIKEEDKEKEIDRIDNSVREENFEQKKKPLSPEKEKAAAKTIISKRIDYDNTKSLGPVVDNILDLMTDVAISQQKSLKIAKEDRPISEVQAVFNSINPDHIKYIVESWRRNSSRARNVRAYLLTTIYNAPSTMAAYYSNREIKEDDKNSHDELKKRIAPRGNRDLSKMPSHDIYDKPRRLAPRGNRDLNSMLGIED